MKYSLPDVLRAVGKLPAEWVTARQVATKLLEIASKAPRSLDDADDMELSKLSRELLGRGTAKDPWISTKNSVQRVMDRHSPEDQGQFKVGNQEVFEKKKEGKYVYYRIRSSKMASSRPKRFGSVSTRNLNPEKRLAAEIAAVGLTTRHFEAQGYSVQSVERDNVGWDLEARKGRVQLKVEVKGRSSHELNVELTPNEYQKMQKFRRSYRLVVVTSATSDPTIFVFAYRSRVWRTENGEILDIQELTGARCTADPNCR